MRKLKNLLIAVIAISMLTVVIPVSATVTVTDNYIDMQFEDSENLKVNSATGGLSMNVTGKGSFASDLIRNSGVVKITMPALEGSETNKTQNWYINNDSPNISGLGSKVAWYELSFYFEDNISGISLCDKTPVFYIGEDGKIMLGGLWSGYSAGSGREATNAVCQPNKWYHLVIASDYVDAYVDNEGIKYPKFYAWLNGELLLTGQSPADKSYTMPWNNSVSGDDRDVMTRIRLYPHKYSNGESIKYLDNFKIYTSSTSVAADLASSAFDPTDIYDGTEITSDSLTIVDDKIYVDADATLQDVDDAVTVTTSSVYYDGTTAVADTDIATTTAVGKTVYVRSTGGIGVKAYTIEEMPAYMLDKCYVNMDYEIDVKTNSASDAFGIEATQCYSGRELDTVRDSYVNKRTLESSADKNSSNKSNGFIMGSASNLGIDISKRTAWYELSFKMDSLGSVWGICDRDPIFGVAADGTVTLVGFPLVGVAGQQTDAQIEAGKWYHMVVAVDHLDKGAFGNTEYAKIYAWLNGKLLKTNTADSKSSALYATSAISGGNKETIDRVRIQMYYPEYNETAKSSTLSVDNFKIYTTYTPVLDSEGNYSIDPMADYAKVSSGTLTVVDDSIYAAENASFADVYSALTLTDADAVVNASGTDISASTDKAKDSTIYVRSESGIGINTYTVKAAPEYGIIADTAAWTVADGKATLTTYFSNRGAEKGCVLILASYNSDGLVNVCTTDLENVPAAGKEVVSNPIEVGSDDLTIRAFVWSSKSGLVPLTTVCDSLPAYAG